MTTDVKYCFDDQDIEEVTLNMGDIQVRRLPVVDPVEPGDVLEVLPHAEVVVQDRVVARIAQDGARGKRSGDSPAIG